LSLIDEVHMNGLDDFQLSILFLES